MTESPPVSPSVVAAIFITQKVNVTSGTLLHTRSRTSFMLFPFAAFETVAQFVEDYGENSPSTDHAGGHFDAQTSRVSARLCVDRADCLSRQSGGN